MAFKDTFFCQPGKRKRPKSSTRLADLDTASLSLVKTVVDEGKINYGDNVALDYLWRKCLEYLDANELSECIDV